MEKKTQENRTGARLSRGMLLGMIFSRLRLAIVAAALSLALYPSIVQAQSGQTPADRHTESPQELVARLNPQQKQQFEEAMANHRARRYADAAAAFKTLLNQFPGDVLLVKYASNSSLDSGDPGFALNLLKPIAQADPSDWQADAMLTRACAETGDIPCRDAGIAHMLDLSRQGITPQGFKQYVVERIKVAKKTLEISTSLVPWGYYNIYDKGEVMDEDGKAFLQTTIESNDGDQALFAKQHPQEAASGLRLFSLDAYLDTGRNSSGQLTQTHFTYKLFTGQPTYATVREEFIKVVKGESKPITSRSNLIVP